MRTVMRLCVISAGILLGVQASLHVTWAEEGKATQQPSETHAVWFEQHPECDAIFNAIHKPGGVRVSLDRWPRERFFSDTSSDVIESIRAACTLAGFLGFCPHRLGLIDAMSLAAPMLDDYSNLIALDEALFGYNEAYAVELQDSPAIVDNLVLLSHLPEVGQLTIFTKRTDAEFLEAVRKVKVTGEVRLRDPSDFDKKSGFAMGAVVDTNGKPVADATVMIYSPDGVPIVGGKTSTKGDFFQHNIRKGPYRIEAFAPVPPFAAADSRVASSEPVNTESWALNVRLVIDSARLVPQPPKFRIIEDDDGRRITFDLAATPGERGLSQ